MKFTDEILRNLPRYVRLHKEGSCLRLRRDVYGEPEYYRDGGHWSVNITMSADGNLISSNKIHSHLDNCPIIACTEQEWRKCNGGYATGVKAHNLGNKPKKDQIAF